MIGRTIGTYRVLEKIGEGGMGTVFVGEHTLLGRRAAIKVLLPQMSASESILSRFFNEARLVTSISDPGIVQVFDYGVQDGSAYIVMELLEGETIQTRLKRMRRLPTSEVLRLGRQIATSLSAAHAKNIVHRDLKPENIFIIGDPAVTGGERTKILDFGIAKLLQVDGEADSHKTQTGVLMGTPVYMSPEQCRGAGEVDHRSDIYSLGCVLFRMLAGRPPFDGRGSGELIASHLKEPAPLVSTLLPDVSPELETILSRCLAKDPAHRPQTALDLANLLGAVELGPTYRTPVPGFAPPIGGVHDAYTVQISANAPAFPTEASTPTTMQGASGQAASHAHSAIPKKRRALGIFVGIAACVLVGGVIAVVAETGGSGGTSETVRPMTSSPSPEPTPTTGAEPQVTPTATTTEPAATTAIEKAPAPATPNVEKPAAIETPTATATPKPTRTVTTRPATKPVTKPSRTPAKPKPTTTTTEPKPKPGAIDRGD